jgi:hypothetical protein
VLALLDVRLENQSVVQTIPNISMRIIAQSHPINLEEAGGKGSFTIYDKGSYIVHVGDAKGLNVRPGGTWRGWIGKPLAQMCSLVDCSCYCTEIKSKASPMLARGSDKTNPNLIPEGGIRPPRRKASSASPSGLHRNRRPLQPSTCLGRPEADLAEALGRPIGGGCLPQELS